METFRIHAEPSGKDAIILFRAEPRTLRQDWGKSENFLKPGHLVFRPAETGAVTSPSNLSCKLKPSHSKEPQHVPRPFRSWRSGSVQQAVAMRLQGLTRWLCQTGKQPPLAAPCPLLSHHTCVQWELHETCPLPQVPCWPSAGRHGPFERAEFRAGNVTGWAEFLGWSHILLMSLGYWLFLCLILLNSFHLALLYISCYTLTYVVSAVL